MLVATRACIALDTGLCVIFIAGSDNLVLLLLEDVAQVLSQLLDFLLLLNDLVVQEQVLVLYLGIGAHLPISLLHAVDDPTVQLRLLGGMVHAALGHSIVRR